jgi:thioredoxin-related protein
MQTILRTLAICIAGLLVTAAQAASWTDNYPSAVAQAKKEHKLLLLDFTGSDWCIWCQRMDKDVFATKKFSEFADQNLVLVMLDFPQSHALRTEVASQNAALQQKYAVDGYPTIIVLDPDEKVVFTQKGYRDGGPDAFLAQFPKN